MKINNSIILSLGLAVSMVACKSESKGEKQEPKPVKVEKREAGKLKIAYYDQDTLKVRFEFFKEQEKSIERRQKAFEAEIDKMSKEYQDFIRRNDEKARQGLLSQIQIQGIQEQAAMKERKIMEFQQQRGASIEKDAIAKLEEIGQKIDNYSKMFSEENGIDILLIKAKGGQLSYINADMDVTDSFIDFLNSKEEEIKKDMGKK